MRKPLAEGKWFSLIFSFYSFISHFSYAQSNFTFKNRGRIFYLESNLALKEKGASPHTKVGNFGSRVH